MANQVSFSNGHVYSDDGNPSTGMGNKGHQTRLIPMLADMIIEMAGRIGEMVGYRNGAINAKTAAETARDAAAASASAAATSAQTAALGPSAQATSTSNLTIGTGSKTLTIQTGKTLSATMFVLVANGIGKWMHGQITSYDSGSGALVVEVTTTDGAGTFSAWTVSVSSPKFNGLPALVAGKLLGNDGSTLGWTDALGRNFDIGPNLIANPTWSRGLCGWLPSGSAVWTPSGRSRGGEGPSVAASQAGAGSSSLLADRMPVSAGVTYTLTAEVNTLLQVGGTAYVDVLWYDAGGAYLSESGQQTVAAGLDWTDTAISISSPAGSAFAAVRAMLDTATSSTGTRFKRVKFEAGASATMFDDPGIDGTTKQLGAGATYTCTGMDGPFEFTGSGSRIDLPANPDDGLTIPLRNGTAVDNIIGRNGRQIMGRAEDLVLTLPYASFSLTFMANSNNWVIV